MLGNKYIITGSDARRMKIDDIIKEHSSAHIYKYNSEGLSQFIENAVNPSVFAYNELLIYSFSEESPLFTSSIEDISKSNKVIILNYDGSSKKLINKIVKYGFEHIDIKEDKKNVVEYVKKELNIDDGLANELIQFMGDNFLRVFNEIEKIKLILNGDSYNFESIKPILTENVEYTVYGLIEDILDKKEGTRLENISLSMYNLFLYQITSHLITMLKSKKIFTGNMSYNKFKEEYSNYSDIFNKAHPYSIYMKYLSSKKYTNDELINKIYYCWNAENMIKTGKIEQEMGVKLLVKQLII